MTKGKLIQQKERGARAARLLEDELIKDAFEVLEKTILDGWKNTVDEETEKRVNAYLLYRLLQNFKQQFRRALATGKAAEKELLTIKDASKIRRLVNGS